MAPITYFLRSAAIAALILVSGTNAQSPTTTTTTALAAYTTASQTWSGPVATCINALPTPAGANGTYIDTQGAGYQVNCGQQNTLVAYYAAGQGTKNQGIYACFKSCNRRPGCIGFYFIGTVSSPTAGTGRCYYQNGLNPYTIAANVYAGANLISAGSPRTPCPYYSGSIFTDVSGVVWQMLCGVDTASPATGSTTVSDIGTQLITDCMTRCNALANCVSFMFNLFDADLRPEPLDSGAVATDLTGTCYLRTSLFVVTSQPGNGGLYGYAVRVPGTPSTISTISTTTRTTATTAVRSLLYKCSDIS